MDSASNSKLILFPNGSEFSVPSPIDSSDFSPRSEYFFSPKVVEQFINSPIHILSSSPKHLNTYFPENLSERSSNLPSIFPFNDKLLDKSLYDSMLLAQEIRSPIATGEREACSTSLAEFSQERTTLLTAQSRTNDSHINDCASIRDKIITETSFPVLETCSVTSDSACTPDQHDLSTKSEHNAEILNGENNSSDKAEEDTLENRFLSKSDSKEILENNSTTVRNIADVWVSNESVVESSATISPPRSENGSDGPPAKRRKKYRPRIHVPKTLNLRGRPRKNPISDTKPSLDPIGDFTKTLPPYLYALNNFNPAEIPEYQELLASRNLEECLNLTDHSCDWEIKL